MPETPSPFAPHGVRFTPVSPSLSKARFIVVACWLIPLLIAAVILAVAASGWVWIAAVALVAIGAWLGWLIPRQVRALGYAEAQDDLLIRRGIMFRSLVVVPYGRMQYVDVAQGPIARACGVSSIQLHTASAATDASIDGLPPAEAERLRDRLTARGETKLAGL